MITIADLQESFKKGFPSETCYGREHRLIEEGNISGLKTFFETHATSQLTAQEVLEHIKASDIEGLEKKCVILEAKEKAHNQWRALCG